RTQRLIATPSQSSQSSHPQPAQPHSHAEPTFHVDTSLFSSPHPPRRRPPHRPTLQLTVPCSTWLRRRTLRKLPLPSRTFSFHLPPSSLLTRYTVWINVAAAAAITESGYSKKGPKGRGAPRPAATEVAEGDSTRPTRGANKAVKKTSFAAAPLVKELIKGSSLDAVEMEVVGSQKGASEEGIQASDREKRRKSREAAKGLSHEAIDNLVKQHDAKQAERADGASSPLSPLTSQSITTTEEDDNPPYQKDQDLFSVDNGVATQEDMEGEVEDDGRIPERLMKAAGPLFVPSPSDDSQDSDDESLEEELGHGAEVAGTSSGPKHLEGPLQLPRAPDGVSKAGFVSVPYTVITDGSSPVKVSKWPVQSYYNEDFDRVFPAIALVERIELSMGSLEPSTTLTYKIRDEFGASSDSTLLANVGVLRAGLRAGEPPCDELFYIPVPGYEGTIILTMKTVQPARPSSPIPLSQPTLAHPSPLPPPPSSSSAPAPSSTDPTLPHVPSTSLPAQVRALLGGPAYVPGPTSAQELRRRSAFIAEQGLELADVAAYASLSFKARCATVGKDFFSIGKQTVANGVRLRSAELVFGFKDFDSFRPFMSDGPPLPEAALSAYVDHYLLCRHDVKSCSYLKTLLISHHFPKRTASDPSPPPLGCQLKVPASVAAAASYRGAIDTVVASKLT
ncbi:hypothetical protein P7C70_g8869, partial [Phenoliferia sp. Uapishka_3]